MFATSGCYVGGEIKSLDQVSVRLDQGGLIAQSVTHFETQITNDGYEFSGGGGALVATPVLQTADGYEFFTSSQGVLISEDEN